MTDNVENIIKSLEDIAYAGPLLDKDALSKALEEAPKSIEYAGLVSFLTNELRSLCNIDEQVNKIAALEDSVSFLMELGSFLKELGCSHESLTQGYISDRLVQMDDRVLLLEYLISELMSARIIHESKPEDKIELKLQETPHAANMKRLLSALRFPKPPANLSMQTLFAKLRPTIEGHIKKGGGDLIGTPIFNLSLTEKQWYVLNEVQRELHTEYTIRREMLLKRLDCTIQSFQWSDKMRGKDELITKMYSEKRRQLRVEPDVNIADLISARDDLAIIEKTSSASVRRNTKSSINNIIIGQVPDRGGRTSELAPPPPEMPSWQQRAPGGGDRGGRGGRGGGGRGRGDFSRGGRQSNDFNKGSNDFNRGGNDYNRGGNTYNRGGNDYNRGGNNNFNRGGNDYNKGGNDFNRGSSDFNRGGNDYNKTDTNYDRGSYSAGGGNYSRGSTSNYGSGGGSNDFNKGSAGNYSTRGGNDYNKGSTGRYSARGVDDYNRSGRSNSDYSRGGFDSAGSYGNSSYSTSNQNKSTYPSDYNKGKSGYGGGFDSAGNYGGYQDYQSNEPKRAKTFDYFQTNKTTYADQYVQESQLNKQYQPRGRGQSYNRGGGY